VIGFGDAHTRAHLYRAILEGLAYALREGRERIERRGGSRIERVRVSGGGSQSDAAMQITANVFNLPAERPHLFETSGLGAAIIAAVGLGLHPDFDTAVREMTRVGQTFRSRPDSTRALTTRFTARSIAACTAAAAALPRHTRDHRLSGAALGRGGDQRRDVQRGGQRNAAKRDAEPVAPAQHRIAHQQ
jgi:sugar (pentulose or hexulose) kinase